jgi:flagellar hook-associated protein 2
MDKLYNADSASDYDPLTDDEKDEMSDSEVEKWETKIKDALLRKDSTLGTVSSALKNIMLQGVTMSDGSKMYLSSFGIETLGYFTAADNEKNAYHIDGDPDDSNTSGNSDKLKTMIANDPSTVVEFFTTLSKSLYSKLGDLMKSTDYSSAFTLYDDKYMQTQYDDYTDKISDQEDLIADYEDRYYSKFTAMETALTKLNSKESAISGLLS